MTQEDKELLLKYLYMTLPYEVEIQVSDWTLLDTTLKIGHITRLLNNDIKLRPYLRTMSSMTEDEKREIYNWLVENDVDWFDFNKLRLDEILISFDSSWLLVNWLLKNHFDFMGLIEKGLALEAPEGMYNIN